MLLPKEYYNTLGYYFQYPGYNKLTINRLNVLNGKIKYNWLNLSMDSFKLKCQKYILNLNSNRNDDDLPIGNHESF